MDARSSRYHEVYARWQRDPEGFWAEAADRTRLVRKAAATFDPKAGIYGRWFPGGVSNTCFNAVDRQVECRTRRAGGHHLRFAARRHQAHHHLSPAADRDAGARRHAARPRRRKRRPRHSLHADGAGGGDRHARLRAHRRRSFGGVRRLCRARIGDPHRRRQAEGDPVGQLRHRARPHRALQAAARRSDHAGAAQARRLPHPATAAGGSGHDRRPRP